MTKQSPPRVRINGQAIDNHRPRITGHSPDDILKNVKRMANAIYPRPVAHRRREHCNCKVCSENFWHQWTILKAVYRWNYARIARAFNVHSTTPGHAIMATAGMSKRNVIKWAHKTPQALHAHGKKSREGKSYVKPNRSVALKTQWHAETLDERRRSSAARDMAGHEEAA